MLETIREYSMGQLDDSAEAAEVERRHARYYAHLLLAIQPRIRAYDPEATTVAMAELPNAQVGLATALRGRDVDTAGMYVYGLFVPWLGLGRNHEAVRAARQYLELCDAISGSDAARFWGQLGTSEILRFSGDPELAGTIKRELVDALEAGSDLSLGALPSRPKLAPLLTDLAAIELDLGRLESARAFAARGLEQRRRDGVGKGVAHALNTVAAVEIASENFRLAREHHAEALALMAAEGSPEVVDHQLGLAEAEMLLGDVQAARGWLREALGSPLLVQDVAMADSRSTSQRGSRRFSTSMTSRPASLARASRYWTLPACRSTLMRRADASVSRSSSVRRWALGSSVASTRRATHSTLPVHWS
jgi:tetratricopeptide (TPR) repeat protein